MDNLQRQNGTWFFEAHHERAIPGGGKETLQTWKKEGRVNMTKTTGNEQGQAHVKLGRR